MEPTKPLWDTETLEGILEEFGDDLPDGMDCDELEDMLNSM